MPVHFNIPSPLQQVPFSPLNACGISLYVKRDDLIHPEISGNKWRKLQHNMAKAMQRGSDTILTLGGAHSNHIAATAYAAARMGLKSIGIIRAEDADLSNPTLSQAAANGMHLHRISREEYRQAGSWDFIESLKAQFGRFYYIPEGGANLLGAMGCMDIMKELQVLKPERVYVACGTATTLSGMALANGWGAQLCGVSALKGGAFLIEHVRKLLHELYQDEDTTSDVMQHIALLDAYHFGGYARINAKLVHFMQAFFRETGIKLDPVYTAKCAWAMQAEAGKRSTAAKENWVLIHSGGLQGIAAMEARWGTPLYPEL